MKILHRFGAIELLLVLGIAATPSPSLGAYNRQDAYTYARDWYFVDSNSNTLVDHIDHPPYTWFYHPRLLGIDFLPNPFLRFARDDGSDTINQQFGKNCTNFVSQVLQAGDVTMYGDWPDAGNVFSAVSRLAAALPQISDPPQRFKATDTPPTNLDVGDVIQWNNSHMTVVVATGPIRLAYHSRHVFGPITGGGFLSNLFAQYKEAVAYHIIGGTITAPDDVTSPSGSFFNFLGQPIMAGGATGAEVITVRVEDSGIGVGGLEVTRGAPIIDSMRELEEGFAEYIFTDYAPRGASHEYTVDLSALADGDSVFLQMYDRAGNATLVKLKSSQTPFVVVNGKGEIFKIRFMNGVKCGVDPGRAAVLHALSKDVGGTGTAFVRRVRSDRKALFSALGAHVAAGGFREAVA